MITAIRAGLLWTNAFAVEVILPCALLSNTLAPLELLHKSLLERLLFLHRYDGHEVPER